jgi:hypothetical protein
MFMLAIDNAEDSRNELHLEEGSLSQGSTGRLGLAARLLIILFTLTYWTSTANAQEKKSQNSAAGIGIKGQVSDPKGNALPKASVQLVAGDRVLAQTTTGQEGKFQLTIGSAGEFLIKA